MCYSRNLQFSKSWFKISLILFRILEPSHLKSFKRQASVALKATSPTHIPLHLEVLLGTVAFPQNPYIFAFPELLNFSNTQHLWITRSILQSEDTMYFLTSTSNHIAKKVFTLLKDIWSMHAISRICIYLNLVLQLSHVISSHHCSAEGLTIRKEIMSLCDSPASNTAISKPAKHLYWLIRDLYNH